MNYVNALVSGVLLGGLYALYASGLSLLFGVMRLVNLAHGDLSVLAAYVALIVFDGWGWNPFASLVVVLPLAFATGYVLQKVMFDRLVGTDPAFQIVATFGLALVISNALLKWKTADQQRLQAGNLDTRSVQVTDQVSVGVLPLITFLVAVGVLALLSLFLRRTRLGRAFRATSDDPEAARLMGIDNRRIYAIALGLTFVGVALAGVFNGVRTNFSPFTGTSQLIYAFEAVIIGGLGSIWGTLAGGIILGVAQTVGDQWQPGYFDVFGHLVFLAVLVVRPTGLFGKAMA